MKHILIILVALLVTEQPNIKFNPYYKLPRENIFESEKEKQIRMQSEEQIIYDQNKLGGPRPRLND